MKNKIIITITITDDDIALYCQNKQELTAADIVDSIKMLDSLANDMHEEQ